MENINLNELRSLRAQRSVLTQAKDARSLQDQLQDKQTLPHEFRPVESKISVRRLEEMKLLMNRETQFIFHEPKQYADGKRAMLYSIARCSLGIYDVLCLLSLAPSHWYHTIDPPKYPETKPYRMPSVQVIEPDRLSNQP